MHSYNSPFWNNPNVVEVKFRQAPTTCRMLFSMLFLFVSLATSFGQISGYGVLDGMYGFSFELEASEDSFMEGGITYEGSEDTNVLVATTRGDTLRCQELDDYLDPVTTFLLIKRGNQYEGEWIDEEHKVLLPVIVYSSKSNAVNIYKARRRLYNSENSGIQLTIDIPLSPTVSVGKYIDEDKFEVKSYSSQYSFNQLNYYSAEGVFELEQEKLKWREEIPMENYRYRATGFSIEALIPVFSENFVDSLQSALVRWKEHLEEIGVPVSSNRFPTRLYALCDLDFWSDDFVSGSFEYVSPSGDGSGFTFIFDRRSDRFIPIEQLIRSGELPNDFIKSADLGLSFDRFGIIAKGKFNTMSNRASVHKPWSKLNIRLKRKLNDNIR